MNIRHNIRLAAVLAATVLAAGCGKDKMEFEPVPVPTDEKGFLVLAGMNVGITTEVETLENGNLEAQAATRAATEADGAYLVQINSTTATQEVAWSGSYADIKAMTEPLSLAPGRYTIAAQSPEEIPDAAWETPRYAGSTECSIIKKQTTTVNDLTCSLSNIKATVELSADLKSLFLNDGTDDLQVAVALGDARMVFGRDETRAAYFRAPQASNQMTVTLTGRYNVKGEGETPVYQPVTMTQQIGNVRAGQWRKINISIQHADQGNVKFIVTVQTWVYDSPLVVDVMSKDYAVYEEEIPDVDDEVTMPGSPVLLLDCTDHRITDPFRITAASFDFDYTPVRSNHPLKIIGTPQDGTTIADAHCVFGSDNPDFLAALESAGYAGGVVQLLPANDAGGRLVVNIDALQRLSVKFTDEGMYELYGFAGRHTAKFVVTDSQNRRSYTTLTIDVIRSASTDGPQIVGLDGFDLTTRHTITVASTPKVALHITSATGITAFKVYILGGEVLPDNELKGLDLAPEMDLIHPESEAMENRLRELGFLPKDGGSIEGATDMTFDITEFIPAMCVLPGKGNCDFRLEVTDASGTKEASLMFDVAQ